MIPNVGEIYERYVEENGTWRLQSRKILDVTERSVLYQILPILDEENTRLVSEVEIDDIDLQSQVSLTDWQKWARLARKV